MDLQAFDSISRAGRLEPTGMAEPGRQEQLIAPDRQDQKPDDYGPHIRLHQRLLRSAFSTTLPIQVSSPPSASIRAQCDIAMIWLRTATSSPIVAIAAANALADFGLISR